MLSRSVICTCRRPSRWYMRATLAMRRSSSRRAISVATPCAVVAAARAIDRVAPAGVEMLAPIGGSSPARTVTVDRGSCASSSRSRQTPTARPASHAAPSADRSADSGADDRHAEHVGLKLHERVVPAGAAVGEQRGRRAGVLAHRVEDVADLIGDRLDAGAREMSGGRAAAEAAHQSPRRRRPSTARRAPPTRARNTRRRCRRSIAPGRRRRSSRAEPEELADPIHGAAGHGDVALERVLHAVPSTLQATVVDSPWRERTGAGTTVISDEPVP